MHMSILTTAEHRAVDAAVGDIHHHILHIGRLVEEHALVALTRTEEVAGQGVRVNLLQRAGHAQRAATHCDRGRTVNVGSFVAAIDVGKDMAAGDIDIGVAFHPSGTHNVSAYASIGVEIRHAA